MQRTSKEFTRIVDKTGNIYSILGVGTNMRIDISSTRVESQWSSSVPQETLQSAARNTATLTIRSNESLPTEATLADAASRDIGQRGLEPSVIYHETSDKNNESVIYSQPLKVKVYKIAKMPDTKAIDESQKSVEITLKSLGNAWAEFKKSLASIAPDLAKMDFGFTLDANGKLLATSGKSSLSATERDRLTDLLNHSESLVNGANLFANHTFAFAKSHADTSFGRLKFDMENFSKIIDIGKAISADNPPPNSQISGIWWIQIGEKAAMDPARLAEFTTPFETWEL